MKAIIMDRHGGLDVLRYGDLPDPVAEEGQVVVDIHAASVNSADCKVREGGSYATVFKFPYVLGRDFSGTVASLGAGVSDFAIGEDVFGVLVVVGIHGQLLCCPRGGLAEFDGGGVQPCGVLLERALLGVAHPKHQQVGDDRGAGHP